MAAATERIEHLRVADLKPHPEADIVPRMRPDEWAAFLCDVSRRGVQEPLLIQEGGIVLDGRHRLEAAEITETTRVPCRIVDLSAKEQLDTIIKAATLRRHLSDDQRAALAAKLQPAVSKAAVAEHSKLAGKASGASRRGEESNTSANGADVLKRDTRKELAQQLNVSEKKVRIAAALQKHAPELAAKVLAGDTKLAAAAREALNGMPTPKEVAEKDPARRWSSSLHKLYVLMNSTRDLGGIKKLARNWSPAARKDYVKELRRIIGELEAWIPILDFSKR